MTHDTPSTHSFLITRRFITGSVILSDARSEIAASRHNSSVQNSFFFSRMQLRRHGSQSTTLFVENRTSDIFDRRHRYHLGPATKIETHILSQSRHLLTFRLIFHRNNAVTFSLLANHYHRSFATRHSHSVNSHSEEFFYFSSANLL